MLARKYSGDLSPVLTAYAPAYLTAYRTAKAKQLLPPSTTIFDTFESIYLDFLTNPANEPDRAAGVDVGGPLFRRGIRSCVLYGHDFRR